ncbi:invasin [Buttiauxella noackiae ATCC 51607]|uniref:Invasin n=1 Tax=Buttiauxella noackiae ATCC 51607 TaxID=1354255 RepID=A0A1B7HG50_9ENTR|nr:invasin [Buttiauxella noackiae ATCC 51607]
MFRGQWMYGTNVFFDNDITGHNRRVGIGAEAWTNYLRFSANSYFGRVTGIWRGILKMMMNLVRMILILLQTAGYPLNGLNKSNF